MSVDVSVVVPVFNVAPFIDKCLESIRAQTLSNIEILCIDDAGTDASMTTVEKHADDDARIRILRHSVSRGPGAARNTGLAGANGRFVCFVDSDDWIFPDKLEREYDAIASRDLAWVWSKHLNFIDDGQDGKLVRPKVPTSGMSGAVSLRDDCYYEAEVWNKMYRLEAIRRHGLLFPEGLFYEDLEFTFKFRCLHPETYIINADTYCYRRRDDSIMGRTATGEGRGGDLVHVLRNCWNFLLENGFRDLWKEQFLTVAEKHARRFILSEQYHDEVAPLLLDLLREMDFPDAFDVERHPLFAALCARRDGRLSKPVVRILGILNAANPSRSLRRRYRDTLKLLLLKK